LHHQFPLPPTTRSTADTTEVICVVCLYSVQSRALMAVSLKSLNQYMWQCGPSTAMSQGEPRLTQ